MKDFQSNNHSAKKKLKRAIFLVIFVPTYIWIKDIFNKQLNPSFELRIPVINQSNIHEFCKTTEMSKK